MIRDTQWELKELNAGARDEGFKSWADLKTAIGVDKRKISGKILANIKRNKGKYIVPMTAVEAAAKAAQSQVINTWTAVTQKYPDFEDAMKEFLDNRTNKPDLKKINRLKISPEKKWNEMSGIQKQFILKFNKDQFQPYKGTITTEEMGKLSKFKSIGDVASVDPTRPYNIKNGVVQLDQHFYRVNRAKRFQDYLKNEGIVKVSIPSPTDARRGRWKTTKPVSVTGRWKLSDKAIKEGKTFASILGAFPNLSGSPSTEYQKILAKITHNHPIYKDTQQGLRSLFNFVKDSINTDMEALKPHELKKFVANNPQLLKRVTGRINPETGRVIFSGIKGLDQMSYETLLGKVWLNTEHNRPMRDYASKYMDKARLKVLAKNLRNIDADMAHNISIADEWYNNSLKETATRLAESNPKLLPTISEEFKKMGQRIYVGDKFYGVKLATDPKYTTSIIDYWRNNLKGIGLEEKWDEYASKFNKRGIGTIDNILSKTLKDKNALRTIGTFFGCPGTFKDFDEGGRVRLQTGGQGLARCVDTKLKQPGAMEKLAALPEEVSGTLGKLRNATRGFLGMLGRGGVKAAPYAAIAAAGAAIEPLVKQFRSDDPTTYLSDENQQKGMLLSMIEGETPKVDEDILKWQYPGMAASAAAAIPGSSAMMKARRAKGFGTPRAALGPVGKFLAGSFSPLGVAATLPISIAAERKGGTDWGDIATDPGHWMGPAFASAGAEMATKGIKNPLLLKAIRLGMKPSTLRFISSKLGMPGLALTAGMWGYDRWKKARDD